MSRPILAALVTILIAVLTAAVYFVTTSNLEDRVRAQVENRVTSAQNLLARQYTFEALARRKNAEALARDKNVVKALEGPNAALAAARLRAFRADVDDKPDILALLNKKGKVLVLLSGDKEVDTVPELYLKEDGKPRYQAIAEALSSPVNRRQLISEVWNYQRIGPMKVAVAPVVDSDFGEIEGAVVIAYSFSAEATQREKRLLGADVAYFFDNEVHTSSLERSRAQDLAKPLFGEKSLATAALGSENGYSDVASFEIGDDEYVGTAIKMDVFPSQELPKTYPPRKAGAMVFSSVSRAMAPVASVKTAILLLGLGAIIVALIAMAATAKSILGPLDEIEMGIGEIINGNADKVFLPVGSDVDGLANGLNVMLARLLGRPEPGEEEYDDEGNIIRNSALDFDTEGMSPKDAEAMKLAQEPEADYQKRIFEEFVEARRSIGTSVEGVTQESFAAKLRLNESTLKAKYKCKSVRFKVVTKGDKVTLKPVPIM